MTKIAIFKCLLLSAQRSSEEEWDLCHVLISDLTSEIYMTLPYLHGSQNLSILILLA